MTDQIDSLIDAVENKLNKGAKDCIACNGFGKRTVIDPDERMAVTDTCGRCGGSGLEGEAKC